MEPAYDQQVVKCPKCKDNIDITVGRFPGGYNDYGGWVLECASCGEKFSVPVKNPDDLSRVRSGATIVASWDNELENKAQVLAEYGLSDESPQPERLLIKEFGEPEALFTLEARHLFSCGSCRRPIEAAAYRELASQLKIVASAVGSHINFYLAGREAAQEGVSVRIEFACECAARHQARFFRPFSESHVENEGEFWLIDVSGDKDTIDIDGVFSRDHCMSILEKLLLRWRAIHNVVLLAVPFIGFNFPSSEKKVPDLWNRLLKYTDPDKTEILTRKATFTLLKTASKDTAMDVEFLQDWGILNPTLDVLAQKKAVFKRDFHAKFYCGMSADGVEVLAGSFNVHEGGYVENIHLLRYTFEDFERRYLAGMEITFDQARLKRNRRLLEVVIEDGNVTSRSLVRYEASLATPA